MEELETLNLSNICEGALPELLDQEISKVVNNIVDVNADVDKNRKITVELTFTPYSDRGGAAIQLKVVTKLVGAPTRESRMFIHRAGGKNFALPRDARQQEIFGNKGKGPSETKGGVQ